MARSGCKTIFDSKTSFMRNFLLKALFVTAFILPLFAIAQLPEKALKKIDEAKEKFNNDEYDKSEKILTKLTKEYAWSGHIWDDLAKTHWAIWEQKKQSDQLLGSLNISIQDKNGKEKPGGDSLSKALSDLLKESAATKLAFKTFMNTCREGTLKSAAAANCSIYLRMNLIDEKADTDISDSAKREFNKAETQFGKKEYAKAIEYYLKALAIEPKYFKARLYLGDSYYASAQYATANKYYKEATEFKPKSCEAWKFLTDGLYYVGNYDEAMKAATEGVLLYPDINMFQKIEKIQKRKGKKFDRQWIERKMYPKMDKENLEQKVSDKDWKVYADALKEIKPYCNDLGIVTKSNSLTKGIYADVYAFEKMVNQSQTPEFDFAKQMMLKGNFDCYVLFSLYHYDLNGQYQNFKALNKDKLKEYITFLCN